MKINGSCLCGAVHYETDIPPLMSGNCHCKDCQKASGSGYAPTLFFPEDSVRIEGEVRYYAHLGDSGLPVHRGFCPLCGSQLFGKPESMPGLLGIRAGSLDDTRLFQPEIDIYVSRKAPWDHLSPSAITFDEMPPEKI